MLKPFYQAEEITLYHGDCRDILPLLPPVDALVTDPPYNETALDWDTWPTGWPSLIVPLTRSFWCFGSFRMFWERREEFSEWTFSQDVIWEKHNGSSFHSDRFKRVHETMIHLYRGPWADIHKSPPVVTVTEDERRQKSRNLRRGQLLQHLDHIEAGTGYEYDGKRIMRSVIPVRSCHGHAVNETQKPEGIVAPLLEYCVPPGGTVLDCFAGSGTVLAVARRQGKQAIGIEKRESQCQEIVRRLSQKELPITSS